MDKKKKRRLIRWVVLTVMMLVVATLILVLRKDYTLVGYSDATFIPGIVLLFTFLLRLIKNKGAFDVISYAVARMVNGLRREKKVEKFKTASEYLDDKRVSRLKNDYYYLPDIVVASVFVVTGAILAFIV